MKNYSLPKTFCHKPWNEAYNFYGGVGPCGANHNLIDGTFEDYLKSPELKQLREEFLLGLKPESCKICWETEKAGVRSVRQRNKDFSWELQRISLSLTNKCNYKCMTCTPLDSTAWSKDEAACKIRGVDPSFSNPDYPKIDWLIEQCKSKYIYLNVLGGEPLMSDEYHYMMSEIEKHNLYNKIWLTITTNLSVLKYKGMDHLQHWSRFKKLDVYASCDAIGEQAEYIRKGKQFSKFDTNLTLAKDYVKFFSTTVSIYNILYLPELFQYAEERGIYVNFCWVAAPDFLSLTNLTEKDREKVSNRLKNKNFNHIDIDNFLRSSEFQNKKDQFWDYTDKLDLLWSRNWRKSLPELELIYDET